MSELRIVFVCSGNICRSPMAAAIAQRVLAEAQVAALVVSAGTLGIQGMPASVNAVAAVAEVGLDLTAHRSQGLSAMLLRVADHVVVMAPHHEQEIVAREPSAASKIRRLWEHADPVGRLDEIADPVGLDLAAFIECRRDLEQCVGAWIQRLARLRS